MTAPNASVESPASPRRRPWKWLLALPVALVGGVWWFTEPLTDHPTAPPATPTEAIAVPPVVAKLAEGPVAWPEGRLEGDGAKKILLASMVRSVEALEKVEGYTATLRKTERMAGRLGPEQTLAMKVRNRPFAIYLKFLSPKAGKEVVYAEGHHDNKLIAHNGDWTRRIVPRLAVPVDSPLALADSRHPVTEAGLVALARKLLSYRELDIGDGEATTVMDRTVTAEGRALLRSVHTHTNPNARRPFARVEVLYDPATQYPIQITSYDWPATGHDGDLDLAEKFAYDDLKFNAPLTPADFDPANPDYAFMRF